MSDSNVGESISSALSQSTSKLDISDNFNTAKAKDITVIDGDWAASKSISTVENGIKSLIENNNAVIVIDDNADLIKESGANVGLVGFAQDSQAYGMINTSTGQTYRYSVGGMEDINDAVLLAYNWADKTINETNTATTSIIGYPWGEESIFESNINCGNYGIMSCKTAYFKLDANTDYDTYLVQYDLYALPNSGYSKSGMDIYSKVNDDPIYGKHQSLISTSPESTKIDGSASVHLDPGIGNISAYVSWTYTIPDVRVANNSSSSTNTINIQHDINECTNVAYNGYEVLPGALIKVSHGGDGKYHAIDKYSTEFCKVVVKGLWHNEFKSYDMSVEVDTVY